MDGSMAPNKILIFGSTGQIGQHITDAVLAASPPFQSVTAFTSPQTASAKATLFGRWATKGLSVLEGDVHSEDDVSRAFARVDTVVSCLGRNVLGHQTELLRWAARSGTVGLFLPSEYGTDVAYWDRSKDEKPHQMKLAIRRFVEEEVQNMDVIYLVTGPYADMFFHLDPQIEEAGGYNVKERRAVLISDSKPVGFTTMPDVGKGVVAALRQAHAGGRLGLGGGGTKRTTSKVVRMQSFVATPRDILDAFQAQTSGGEAWEHVRYSTLDQVRELEKKMWEEGSPAATLVTLRRIWAEGATLYEETDNGTIGLRDDALETLSDVVARAVKGG